MELTRAREEGATDPRVPISPPSPTPGQAKRDPATLRLWISVANGVQPSPVTIAEEMLCLSPMVEQVGVTMIQLGSP
jgi:hypothetical protein